MKNHFTRVYIQMASKHMKRHSAALVIRKMQNKTITRYHCTPTSAAKMEEGENVLARMWSKWKESFTLFVGV